MNKEMLVSLIDGASGKKPCDLILRNAQVIDVFSGEIFQAHIAIRNGFIVGFGEEYHGRQQVDLKNAFVAPGLIDAHIHIESTLATPEEFSKAASKHGITTVIMDPHEIGNVLGTEGLDYMLASSRNLPVDFQMMLPSCVPATKHETSGAVLNAKDLKPYYANNQTRGLGEVMDLDAVKGTSDDMMHKLADAWNSGKTVDGHGAGLLPGDNNIYRTAGISTDHECTTREEALDRLRKGFYIHIREGSVARNFDELIPLVNRSNHRRFTFCTDDIYINDLFEDGSIDQMVRRAVAYGIEPIDAIRMATLNPSECYGLKTKGAVAPGYEADLVVLSSLENFDIQTVYQKGKLIWDQGKMHYDFQHSESPSLDNTIIIPDLGGKDLKVVSETGKLNVIEVIPNSLLTNHITIDYEKNRNFEADEALDLAKLLVIERHGNHGSMGKGIVKGFHMKNGAVATTIAHDSHNLVALGVNDQDILLAINRIKEIGGGIVITQNGKIMAELKLDIAGLMSSSTIEEISSALKNLKNASRQIFHEIDFNPFLTLSFLTLPVIPELKITDQGLYNTKTARFIGIDEILS